MPFSFPSSPTLNQQSTQNGRVYQWNGYAWDLVGNVANHASSHTLGGVDQISISASQVASGTLSDSILSSKAQAAINLYLWSNFR